MLARSLPCNRTSSCDGVSNACGCGPALSDNHYACFSAAVGGGFVDCPPLSWGLSKHIHRTKRMRHIEDMALTPYQRLHLVEVDGQTFMIHAGKGHAATVVVVNGKGGIVDADAPMTLMDIEKPIQKPALQKSQKVLKQRATRPANAATSPVDENHSKANVDKITSAIAEARRRNPLWVLANDPIFLTHFGWPRAADRSLYRPCVGARYGSWHSGIQCLQRL